MADGDCSRTLGAIEELGDGDLGRLKSALMRRHARSCRSCGGHLTRMEAVVHALAGLERMPAPEDLLELVMACLVPYSGDRCLDHAAEERGRRNLLLVAGAAGFGLALAVALGVVRWALGRDHEDGLAPVGSA